MKGPLLPWRYQQHTKSLRFLSVFFRIFSIFDSFHFLNCLMIVVLQKNSMKPRVAVYIPWIKYMHLKFIYLLLYNRFWALSILYCTWFSTSPQRDLVTTNTLIIYISIYIGIIPNDNKIKHRKWAKWGENSSPLFYPLPPFFPASILDYFNQLSDNKLHWFTKKLRQEIGFNASSRKKIKYPNLRSAMGPVPFQMIFLYPHLQ